MPKTNESVNIAAYLVKYLQGNCDQVEREAVDEWLSVPGNKAIFDNIRKKDAKDIYDKYSIDVSDIREVFYKNFEKKRRFSIKKLLPYAALIAVIVSLPVLFFVIDNSKDRAIADNVNKIELRYRSTVLRTSKGEKIVLDKEYLPKTVKEQNGVRLNINGESLTYDVDEAMLKQGTNDAQMGSADNNKQIAYNTIIVPDCGNFHFTMSDGTKVWLNAGTKLIYPIPFHKDRREMKLSGEAYFEVSKNKKKPFVVNMDKGSVKVLGTKFNIRSYKDKSVTTTLVSGSVEVKDKNKSSVILKPNEQAVFGEKGIKVAEVDPYVYTIWKDGYFVFDKIPLDEILQDLSKWYGFEYFYQNKSAARVLFSARIKKFNDIDEVLNILENTGNIKFRIKNNTLIVTK